MDLPDITQEFIAQTAEYVAKIQAAIDVTKGLADECHAAATAVLELQAAIDHLEGKTVYVNVVTNGVGDTGTAGGAGDAGTSAQLIADGQIEKEVAESLIAANVAEAEAIRVSTDAKHAGAAASLTLAAAEAMLGGATREAAASEAESAGSSLTASGALHGVIGAMSGAGTATRVFGLSMSALHWIAGVTFETLAVLIPAIIAFGAGALVAAQGAMNASNHMEALWTAAEATNSAFHQTMGTLLGLKPTLQAAQDAANPGVYEMLGSAVNDVKAQFGGFAGSGLQVVHMLDEFSARITVDLKNSGGEMGQLLGNMVTDLAEIGQIFGNVGHAILNFAADMPGLAEVLLMVADGISRVILWISELPHWLIGGAMALEEFYRWGGLAASIIARIGLLLPMLAAAPGIMAVALFSRLAGIMGAVVGVGAQLVGGLASVAGGIAKVIPAAGGAATALEGMSKGMAAAASNTMLMGGIGVGIAALVAFGIAMDHIRNSSQQFIATESKLVAAASDMNVMGVLANAIVATSGKIEQQETLLRSYPGASQGVGQAVGAMITGLEHLNGPVGGAVQGLSNLASKTGIWGEVTKTALGSVPVIGTALSFLGLGATRAASSVDQLKASQMALIGTFQTVNTNVGYLERTYHVGGAAAMAMAQEAGVNLQHALTGSGQAAQIARQQIANLVTGLGAMSAPAGVVGNDMEALGIQSQLAGTKVQQLNSAWDAFLSSVTGGMSTLSQVQTAIGSMASDAGAKSASLSGAIGSVSLAGGQMAYTLKGLGADAMQSWQQLTGALTTGGQAADFMRTGMAEGAVSAGQFSSTMKGLVGEFIPFVAGNKTATSMLSALAQEAGGPATGNVKTLGQWAGVTGSKAANQLANGIEAATQKMSNMSAVAQNLGAVVSGDLDSALGASITKYSGVSAAVQQYSRDLANNNTPASVLKQDTNAISTAMQHENAMASTAAQAINRAGNAAAAAGGQMSGAAVEAGILAGKLYSIPNVTRYVSIVYTQSGAAANANPLIHPAGMVRAQHGGVLPGYMPGMDSIPAMLSPGESILNPYATRMVGAGNVNWLNTTAEHGGGSNPAALRTGSGGGAGGPVAEVHSHVYLDGKEIFTAVQQQDMRYTTRNSGARTGRMTP